MVNEASKMLADMGFTVDEETLNFVVRDTAEDTTQAVTAFAKLVDDKVESKRQEVLHGQTPNNASASQGQGKSFGAQMAEKSNSRSLSGAVFKKDNVAIRLVLNDVKGSTNDSMPAALSVDDKTALRAVGIIP
ncbi:DUF4355 domain-containing protein [Weissella paramesenteroides]|nr:DUF4355 domain-containing protein [Weissella paramesenteroides]KAA8455863.1 DUF4355 domain-containing protein [Weissella paramesenteroides]KAA8457397.1 DUF4355 domain-containing protein [Weissella paramesenteroides]KAA8461298.1 DUF4355 domain-containing protein [Weissella paramesenteroides]KAA8466381.1 DUF4355 domain-containing protein [Weissella paramesenteroides]